MEGLKLGLLDGLLDGLRLGDRDGLFEGDADGDSEVEGEREGDALGLNDEEADATGVVKAETAMWCSPRGKRSDFDPYA